MVKTVSAAEAKAKFAALVAAVNRAGEQIIIERRGRPVAALVSVEDLEQIEAANTPASVPITFLSLVGSWSEVGDERTDALVEETYTDRERDLGRDVELKN